MITITTEELATTRQRIPELLNVPELASIINSESDDAPHKRAPFVQIDHKEIAGEQFDRLMGYGNIPDFGQPIGLDYEGRPIQVSQPSGTMVYSLTELEKHVRNEAPDLPPGSLNATECKAWPRCWERPCR